MLQKCIMRPWITFQPQLKGMRGQINLNVVNSGEGQCELISLLSVQRDHLPLISSFELIDQNQEKVTMAYLSDEFEHNNHKYRVIYVPPNRSQQQSLLFLSELMRQLSVVLISDVNSGIHRLKQRKKEGQRQFVVVNSRDVYQVGVSQETIELVKQIQTPLFKHVAGKCLGEEQGNYKVRMGVLQKSILRCVQQWEGLVGGEKNWAALHTSALQMYRAETRMNKNSEKYNNMMTRGHMLSSVDLQFLKQDLLSTLESDSSWQLAVGRQTVGSLMNVVKQQNKSNQLNFLHKLQQQLLNTSLSSFEELTLHRYQIEQTLQRYNINLDFTQFVLFSKEKQLFDQEISRLYEEKQTLNELIETQKQKLNQRTNQINDFKHQLQVYSDKLATLISLEQELKKKDHIIGQLKEVNQEIRTEIQRFRMKDNKQKEMINDLTLRLEAKEKQSKGAHECLQSITSKTISLSKTVQTLTAELQEAKAQISQTVHIEHRALRSIQNQAEVKTRLNRYQTYISDLKIGLQSFKRMQCQKFNYILKQNQKQYQKTQNQLIQTQNELEVVEQKNKELSDALQHEKMRMIYFEKFIAGSSNEPIPECNQEEFSCTDREERVKIEYRVNQ